MKGGETMGKKKGRKKKYSLTEADKILLAAILTALTAIIKLLLGD